MIKKSFKVRSSDKLHTLAGVVYVPNGEVRGYFHIVHGMTEHMGRYERIMTDLAEKGYICFGYDNLGHGRTAKDKSELGFIASKRGDDLLCRDVKVFSDAVMAEYGKTYGELPYYLMGHSMGSFITRLAVEKYVHPDKYIIMGTGGKNSAAGAGLVLIALVRSFKGERHISRLVYRLVFGNYNKRFPETHSGAWLTKNADILKKNAEDDYCTFKFSVSAMGDLVRLNKLANRSAWYKNMPKDMPILLISGECDPVGNYGNGVRQVYNGLLEKGCNVKCILYPDARHEIINDSTYEQVKGDILDFLK